jgi:hypothetical protein
MLVTVLLLLLKLKKLFLNKLKTILLQFQEFQLHKRLLPFQVHLFLELVKLLQVVLVILHLHYSLSLNQPLPSQQEKLFLNSVYPKLLLMLVNSVVMFVLCLHQETLLVMLLSLLLEWKFLKQSKLNKVMLMLVVS